MDWLVLLLIFLLCVITGRYIHVRFESQDASREDAVAVQLIGEFVDALKSNASPAEKQERLRLARDKMEAFHQNRKVIAERREGNVTYLSVFNGKPREQSKVKENRL